MRFNSMPFITRQTAPSGHTDVRRFYHLSAMGKKKKKTRLTEHQQHKLEDAQRRKIYLKRLVDMLKELGYDSVMELLTPKLLEELWLSRTGLARIDLSQATHFDKKDQQYIQREVYFLFNTNKVPLRDQTDAGREILISDFYEIWLPMMLSISHDSIKQTETNTKILLREALKEYGIDLERGATDDAPTYLANVFTEMEDNYKSCLLSFAFQFNNPCMHYFWVSRMEYSSHSRRLNRYITFRSLDPVHMIGPGIKGSRRRIYRVGYPTLGSQEGEIRWLSAKIPRNPYVYFNPDIEYEVYIQEHAVKRMFERLDGVFPASVNIHMHFCFLDWKADWYKGSLIIAFDLYGQKVGYFLADFTADRKIIIRTFYFITYDRTPEGEALASYAGLQASDKKYLGIDRLSTFLASDFDKDSRFASLCREAGLGHLLDLSDVRLASDAEGSEAKSISNDFIEKYLSELEEGGSAQ